MLSKCRKAENKVTPTGLCFYLSSRPHSHPVSLTGVL